MTTGGPLTKAVEITDDQLEINGGNYKLAKRPAIPYNPFAEQTRPVVGGKPVPIYVVDDAPGFAGKPREGGEAFPYFIVTDETAPLGEEAIPVFLVGGGVSYSAEAQALFDEMAVQPDTTRKTLIDDTISDLKSNGIWDLMDECWFLAAHDEQAGLLGWKRYKDATAVNAPTFTADQGFQGDGSSSYLNSNFTPSTDGVNYTLEGASLGVYLRTLEAGAQRFAIGSISTQWSVVYTQSGETRIQVMAGSNTVVPTIEAGLIVGRRTDLQELLRNGDVLESIAAGTFSITSGNIYICATENGGSPTAFDNRQLSFAFIAASLTTQQQSDLFDIVESYMDSIGAGVVT